MVNIAVTDAGRIRHKRGIKQRAINSQAKKHAVLQRQLAKLLMQRHVQHLPELRTLTDDLEKGFPTADTLGCTKSTPRTGCWDGWLMGMET